MMSYRRKKAESKDKRRYEDFRRNNWNLIEHIGIPSFIIDDQENFTYVLMHGAPWPNAPIHFAVSKLDAKRYEQWKMLVDKYFEAGFDDPGYGTGSAPSASTKRCKPSYTSKSADSRWSWSG